MHSPPVFKDWGSLQRPLELAGGLAGTAGVVTLSIVGQKADIAKRVIRESAEKPKTPSS